MAAKLAGANSSGKSSIMQPMLLMKQTLDATYDPGALLLDGPHVTFTAADQLLTRKNGKRAVQCGFGIDVIDGARIKVLFRRRTEGGLDVAQQLERRDDGSIAALVPGFYQHDWFSLTKDGATEVRSADLDETGAFGDWPEDFADVTLEAQARYLDAAERRLARARR